MAQLFADEDVDLPIVHELRRLGHDVLTVHEAGQANRCTPDDAVLDIAVSEGRAVVTLNRRHFIRLHGRRPRHSGIIVCTWDPDRIGLAQRIDCAIHGQSDLSNQLIRVDRPNHPD